MSKPRILVVEDELIVAVDLCERLGRMGYEPVGRAPSAAKAVALAGELRPDLILMDIHLEGESDGIVAATEIREQFDIPVLFLTAYSEDATVERAKIAEPHGYILKPFEDRELKVQIEMVLCRHRAEARLRESEMRYRTVAHFTYDMEYWRRTDGTLAFMSPACERITGYAMEEFLRNPGLLLEIVHPDDRQRVGQHLEAASDKTVEPELRELEFRIHTRSGEERWISHVCRQVTDERGKPVGRRAADRDVTGRKRLEAAFAALALRNQTLLQTASDGIHILDDAGNVVEANRAFCDMLGYTRDEVLRLNVVAWDAQWSGRDLLEKVREFMARPSVFETRHRRKDGTLRDVEIHAAGVRLEGRVYLFASARDVTVRKRLEANTRRLQKSESLGRMAGAVAHHFNNQLAAVLLNLEMALNELPRGSSASEFITEANTSAKKAALISGQLLACLGQTYKKTEPLDLSAVCRQQLSLMESTLPGTVALKTTLPVPGPAVRANAGNLQQVLANLVTNAWEAGGDNTIRIGVSTAPVRAADIPELNRSPIDWQPSAPVYACLEVSDTGCGIPAKDLEKLFDPFFTTKFAGRGLGLAYVLGIIRELKGCATVESVVDRGSVFRVFVPLGEVGMTCP